MLSGEGIVCFAPDPWEGPWRNRHHIMTRLARPNRVLYVEPRVYWNEAWTAWRSGGQASGSLRQTPEGIWVFRFPLWLPMAGRLPGRVIGALRNRMLRGVLRRLGMEHPILWLYRPDHVDLPGCCGEKLVVYYVVDEYAGYDAEKTGPDAMRRLEVLREMEQSLLRRADLVFVVSEPLYRSKSPYNPRTFLVPNGVDFEAFSEAREEPEPPDLSGIPHPRIGYVGVLNDKIDLALLRSVAEERPQWQLVVVGPVMVRRGQEKVDALAALPNVHMLGHRSVHSVPLYMLALDVGLMPYRLNLWTANISPLKLYEYLAAGLPIVSTPIPAVAPFADVVHVAEPGEFVTGIEVALSDRTPEKAERCRRIARQHTWDSRVEEISMRVEDVLRSRPQRKA